MDLFFLVSVIFPSTDKKGYWVDIGLRLSEPCTKNSRWAREFRVKARGFVK